jgi:hypothetical protein
MNALVRMTPHWITVGIGLTWLGSVAACGGQTTGGTSGTNRSVDSGATWINETDGTSAANQAWSGVASDSTGSHLVAVVNSGDIWTR